MKHWWVGVMLGGALSVCVPCANAHADTSTQQPVAQDTQSYWREVHTLLKQGAYREALQTLDVILTITPNDPWAQLYHSLCEIRLAAPSPFAQFTPTQLHTLKDQLRQEEHVQRRTSAQQRALERQVRKEQAKWDQQLKAFERQSAKDERQQRKQLKAQTVTQARAEHAKRKALAEQEALRVAGLQRPTPQEKAQPATPVAEVAPLPTPSTSPPAGEAPPSTEGPPSTAQEPPSTPSRGHAVELPSVVVSTLAAEHTTTEAQTPSLVGHPTPPKGAVQITARQMSVSPDQKVAIADGDVEVVFENAFLTCDHLTLFTDTKDAYAEGAVRLEQGDQVFRGEMVHYNFDTKKGRFLQGTVFSPPWHEFGRSVEHIAEGVYEVTPGYITSCELEPPHFKFYGRRAIVFSEDRLARASNVALFVEHVPFLYLPWLSFADRKSPFFIIPGKKKPWGEFVLTGYRYELPGPSNQKGTIKLDWRRNFLWGEGVDHQFDSKQWGRGLLRVYYNQSRNFNVKPVELPKGAAHDRYRVMWRHRWQPMPDTVVTTDIQKYSDVDFRKDLLFREEFTNEDHPESYISLIRNDPNVTITGLLRDRINSFQTVDNALPQVTFDVRPQRISDTQLFSQTSFDVANFETKNAHSEIDTDVVRLDWFQQLSYALNLFRPIEVTPRAGVRQTFYTKDIQGSDREGQRDLFSGQFSMGADASLKLFRLFPVTSNALGLNLNWLRHIVTPTIGYAYTHRPTVPNELLNFAAANSVTNQVAFGLENKLQTKRPVGKGKLSSVDLARLLISVPYTFRGAGNKQGGRLGDWPVDLELYPWPWLRLETDTSIPSHFLPGSRDSRINTWNMDIVMVGGQGTPQAQYAPGIQAPTPQVFQAGPQEGIAMMPQGQWYLGLGHRYSQNDKTESVLQYDWRFSEKWQIGTFHRFTWKQVAGSAKRFNNLREYQYRFRRDLHDWIGELVYRVDREFGEELFFTLTLKAYPEMPIGLSDSYHQPKLGSQSSPFSPVATH